jgi:hypothetical protein
LSFSICSLLTMTLWVRPTTDLSSLPECVDSLEAALKFCNSDLIVLLSTFQKLGYSATHGSFCFNLLKLSGLYTHQQFNTDEHFSYSVYNVFCMNITIISCNYQYIEQGSPNFALLTTRFKLQDFFAGPYRCVKICINSSAITCDLWTTTG